MLKPLYPELRDGLLAAWCPSTDRSRSTMVMDQSGYTRHLTLTNGDPGTDWVASNGKVAIDLSGVSTDYLSIPVGRGSVGDYTLATWVNLRAHNSVLIGGVYRSYVVDLRGDGTTTQNSIGLVIDKDGPEPFTIQSFNMYGGTPVEYTQNYSAIADPVGRGWQHICITRVGATQFIYLNGTSLTVVHVNTTNPMRSTAMSLANGGRIGTFSGQAVSGPYWLNGQVDDISIYGRALSRNEVTLLARRRGAVYETYRVPVVKGSSVGGVFKPYWAARRSPSIGCGV